MGEIKFRAWDIGSKKWVEDFMEEYGTDALNGADGHFVVEQYTGLKDKNGKEIYEGDIVGIRKPNFAGKFIKGMTHIRIPLVVVYQAPQFVMKEKLMHKTWSEFVLYHKYNQFETIIGNIHENPELLN